MICEDLNTLTEAAFASIRVAWVLVTYKSWLI
jgi:hypothetical protein